MGKALDTPPPPVMTATTPSTPVIDHFSPPVLSHLERIFASLDATKKEGSDIDPGFERTTHFLGVIQQDIPLSPPAVPHGNDVFNLGNLSGFLSYMSSASAGAMSPLEAQDLSLPMTNYFINSSHNTYLTGNQLYSESSTKVYRDVSFLPHSFSFS